MKKTGIFCGVLWLIVFTSCVSSKKSTYTPAQKLPANVLQQDVRLLKVILEENHPGLYWYTPKDTIDIYFNKTIASITDSLTELQFRNKVSWTIKKIRCGHTQVRFSKAYTDYFNGKRLPQFPLQLKAWNDSLVVLNNFLKDSFITRGTVITSINGRPNTSLLDSMYSLIGGDGYTNAFQEQLVSFYFPQYYKSTYGINDAFSFAYIDSLNNKKQIKIPYFKPLSDSLEKLRMAAFPKLSKRERKKLRILSQRNLQLDTIRQTAFMNLNTFSEGKLQSFFKKSFKTIKKSGFKNVVIDVRQNSGGNIFSSIRLLQYLKNEPFTIADSITAIDRKFKYRQHMHPWFIYWLSLHLSGRKDANGLIHFRYFERHQFYPKKKDHFNGNIYVLTGGYTFSAASMMATHLKGQHNITIVGEETGGSAYGNTAVHLPVVTLPNSKLRVVLPLYKMVFNHNKPHNGRGVIPDVQVLPSSTSIRLGLDAKMEKVKQLISQKH